MKTATGSTTFRQAASQASLDRTSAGASAVSSGGQLVFVRTAVVDNVGHVLGNLFQRLYHLADRTRETDTVVAAELESSTTRLEEFLKLLLDYVSPGSLCLQTVPAADVAQSLVRQIADVSGMTAALDGAVGDGQLLVDPGCLARSFALIAGQLRSTARGQLPAIGLQVASSNGSLLMLVRLTQARLPARSSEAEMQWVVAERLIEVQGGSLREMADSVGEVTWEVTLPLQA